MHFSSPLMHATFTAHLILLDLITRIISGEEYKLWILISYGSKFLLGSVTYHEVPYDRTYKTLRQMQSKRSCFKFSASTWCIAKDTNPLQTHNLMTTILYFVQSRLPKTAHESPEREKRYSSTTLSLTLALDEGGWSTQRPGRFTPGKETRYPLYRRMGGP
jgi:hypothetical protein